MPPPGSSGAPWQQHVATADQGACPEWRVHLVGGEHDEIEVLGIPVRLDVDAPVRGELRGIHQDPGAHLACALRARRWIGCTKPVTFEAPETVTSATRSP